MVVGGVLGMAGIPMPLVEQGIVASVVVIGLAAALALSPSLAVGCALAALAGLFHGHAHGTEIPADASGLAYASGFAMATALLHAGGIAITVLAARFTMPLAARAAGGLTAVAGVVLAVRFF
jgi:urease accessory protein